ncbi:MAG TPA: glycosyltransferase [Solirubrobacterales bacterium]|jgi:glycosyltransferase involved in cell wall biosynthesis
MSERIPVLYLAPWVGYGGSDKNTIDWFRWIDQERFAPHLITTQPSPNPLMEQVAPYAEEIWVLPDLIPAEEMPAFIFDFIVSRRIEVLHIMNSKLAFDLLPDLQSLPSPPKVVVQLHVEEVDRSGYVRYVTTRFGNLVDCFSISNRHVADAVHGYGVPREKIEVIYTGVDAEAEFSPQANEPIEALGDDRMDVLFAARLTDQKDPLLMLEVAARLRDRGAPVRFQVVGDGDLEQQVKARAAELDLGDVVSFHPPTPGLQGWYAAADVLLLTSKFEGVPCVVFEAMAMALPIVAPALPGIRELLDSDDDWLIADQAAVDDYVEALSRLAADAEGRVAAGRELHERARSRFSVAEMAALHGAVYERLSAARPRPEVRVPEPLPEPIRFLDRPAIARPPVSVLIPHYNQSHFLRECVESVAEQSYAEVEVVIVDDASTDAGAAEVLAELEQRDGVTVLRLEENGGPSRARNAGLEHCGGRYILPLDSDNLLLADAIKSMVDQLNAAGEDIGFIYPNLDFFGNRDEYHQAPAYNLYTLLHANFCDTCSLLDRTIFDAGARYHPGIKLGHEDWEFALQLAARGVRGEPAYKPTVRYRKWGFNRSDLVDHALAEFRQDFLVGAASALVEREPEIKAREAPALSVVALAAVDVEDEAGRELIRSLAGQSCIDLELVADLRGEPDPECAPAVRRFPGGARLETVERALATARGSFVALTAGTGASLLADPAFAERALRRFDAVGEEPDAIVLVDAGPEGRHAFATLAATTAADAAPHTVIWRRRVEVDLPYGLVADPEAPIASVVRLLTGAGAKVEWRHASFPGGPRLAPDSEPSEWLTMPPDPARADDPRGLRRPAPPLLPGRGDYEIPRWEDRTPTWLAALSTIVIRYRERIGERRMVTTGEPPEGFEIEHFVGGVRSTGVAGTKKLIQVDGTFRALSREEWRDLPGGAIELGYLEEAPLPGLDAIALAVHRVSGQHILVSIPGDPIAGSFDVIEHLGFADPFPLRPRSTPARGRPRGLVGLTKAVDGAKRRYRYGIGSKPAGELVAELGALAETGLQGAIPAWIVNGYLITGRYRPPIRKPSALAAQRWVIEPAAWRDLGPLQARLKVMARRSVQSVESRRSANGSALGPDGDPHGWLFESARSDLVPLYASHHPVTGDQLLTRSTEDAVQMGYGDIQLLGFMAPVAPLTGSLDANPTAVSWARRSGHVPQAS